MIEFKAECGHTVRAKDDDAGSVVRCSYCGRNATVPDAREDELEFLFRDTAGGEGGFDPRGRKRRRGLRLFAKRRTSREGFDPFGVILKMCYAAVLIIIVFVVTKNYILPVFEEGGLQKLAAKRGKERSTGAQDQAHDPTVRGRRAGLIHMNPLGLYAESTPSGAAMYFVEEAQAPSRGRIRDVPGSKRAQANGQCVRVPDGTYAVEVVLPWNDPSLNDPDMPYYRSYLEFRRAIEPASDEERVRLLEGFFVPDDAWSVFINETEEQYFIVRQYRNVRVRDGQSSGVRALFLPKIQPAGRDGFSIGPLVTHYLPKRKAYAFDRDHVQNELAYFYDVPESDQTFVVEGLERIGVLPYVTPNGRTRLFKIGIHDGTFAARVLREASE